MCPAFRYGDWRSEELTSTDVLVEDGGEGWGIAVGRDFGCIHHRQKAGRRRRGSK